MKKQIKIPLVAIILVVLIVIAIVVLLIVNSVKKSDNTNNGENVSNEVSNVVSENITTNNTTSAELEQTADISVVPTMKDRLTTDSAWCGTFQLVWNDLKNEIVGQDILFQEPMEEVSNLNLGEFNTSMISDEYYYKKYGLKTLELKNEIEQGIYEKFGQTSDILDKFDWSDEALHGSGQHDYRYFLYSMLYRKFEFASHFDRLENGSFGDDYQNVKYFGINASTDDSLNSQVQVLYYNNDNDFAVTLETTSGDQVVLCKNPEGSNFSEIYNNMINKANSYTGNREFEDIDELKVPYINLDITKEYEELEGKLFFAPKQGEQAVGVIQKALQSIKLTLDETGGEIKSEAGIDTKIDTALIDPETEMETPRHFYFDNTFAVFLKEENQNLPYFAARIDDITKYQQQ